MQCSAVQCSGSGSGSGSSSGSGSGSGSGNDSSMLYWHDIKMFYTLPKLSKSHVNYDTKIWIVQICG